MKTRTSLQLVQRGALASAVLLSAVLALPAAADWLVTLDGNLIETQGTWKVDGDHIVYTDMQGKPQKMAVAKVDLEGSADTTEARTGKRPELPAKELPKQEAEVVKNPDIVLFATTWCGYCRRARQLFEELDVAFVEKDIEKDAEARREFNQRFGRAGVPVIDVGGRVIRGYSEQIIRQAVKELQARNAELAQRQAGD